jgi:DNA repair exonuclease SbcCD ATPase subunit
MLAGLNGSGKSSIFDAVTYALFGHHRGGSQDAHELINKDSDRALVSFEFALDGQCYRADRTIQRTKQGKARNTQQIFRREGANGWAAVENTNLKTGFDEWVQQNLGLSYETFTSSVLLLQGKAEKLLDSTAKGRFEVLAGIVDLDRYVKLFQRADEERKELAARYKNLQDRLAAIPEVSAAALLEAEARITQAEEVRAQAQAEIDRLQALEFQARHWAELQTQLDASRGRVREAEKLLADAVDIEKDAIRLSELRDVLPRLQTVLEQRGQIQESERKTTELTKKKEHLGTLLQQHNQSLEEARRKREAVEAQIRDEEHRLRQGSAELRRLTALVEKLKECERLQTELDRVREVLTEMPADPETALREARSRHDCLAGLAQAIPSLARFQGLREELRQARTREQAAAEKMQAVRAHGEKLAAEVERAKPEAEKTTRARQDTDDRATRTRTLLEQSQQQLDELNQLHGTKVCRHCGQELTPGHMQQEQKRRGKAVADANARYQDCVKDQREAHAKDAEVRKRLESVEKQLREAREDYREQRSLAEQARKEVERLQRDCGKAYQELEPRQRAQISPSLADDWSATAFPTPDDLAKLRQKVADLPTAKQAVREAELLVQRWSQEKGKEATLQQSLTRIGADLPANRDKVLQEHARLDADDRALAKGLEAHRALLGELRKQSDTLARDRETTQQHLIALDGQLKLEEASRVLSRDVLARAVKDLPSAWQARAERLRMADLNSLRQERDELESKHTDERSRKLQEARTGVELLRRELSGLEEQASQFPEDARQGPTAVKVLLDTARQQHAQRDQELATARQQKARLEERHQEREQLQTECLKADAELTHAKLLAELLSRDRLQLHLVREAERQVVAHANAVLDRLSGGQLFLRLSGEAGGEGNSAKALDLEVSNRHTGDKPINVAFLSGSQKFRVAVSLALGIGQYASRQHRPIESVIIDEGFGCLDRQGRQIMIQELQNLRGQMRCILVVSHQEEFAEAFTDGYRFELTDGTAVATRFQR